MPAILRWFWERPWVAVAWARMAAAAWVAWPSRTARAWRRTQPAAPGLASGWKHQAAVHWVGRAARCLPGRSFSARPPAEPRGHLSVHVALR